MRDQDDTNKSSEVKELLEDEGNFTVEYFHGNEEIINYTEPIKIFNSINEYGSKMFNFENITSHRKLPDNDWGVKLLWDNGEYTWEPM